MHGSEDQELRTMSGQLLELMADVKSPEDLVDRRFDIGMDGLINLSVVDNEPIQVRGLTLGGLPSCGRRPWMTSSAGSRTTCSGWLSRRWWTWLNRSPSVKKSWRRRSVTS